MTSTDPTETTEAVAAAKAGDEAAFAKLAARHRRELHVHCYRMLGSFDQAEDVVQDALLNAWRGLPAFACYLRRPGDTDFRAFKLDIFRVEEGEVAEFTTFDSHLFPAFGLDTILRG